MKKALTITLAVIGIVFISYKSGPHPTPPDLQKIYQFELPSDLSALEAFVKERESKVPGIKADNEGQFVWADSMKAVTPYSLVYIHGFSASHEEGAPVHENLAKRYGANLYKARMDGHGIDLGDETMINMNVDNYLASAEEALAIGKKIGDKVILIGTSAGGALTAYLASKHPEIEAIVLYSPCIEIKDPSAALLDNPWGRELAEMIQGKPFNDFEPKNETQPKYWATHYRLEGLVTLQNFMTHTMLPENFEKIKCPVFLGYYYEDEENQDQVVSVPALLKMFDNLGSTNKQKMAFPTTKNHVLASWVLSEDWKTVETETATFLDGIIKR